MKIISGILPLRDRLLTWSIGLIYLWFGSLKFFPGVSPAEELAKATVDKLVFHLLPTDLTYFLLAVWEVLIGALLFLNLQKKLAITLALVHLLFTFTPLFLFPSLSFQSHDMTLTLIGQYILKNVVIVCALLYLYPERRVDASAHRVA